MGVGRVLRLEVAARTQLAHLGLPARGDVDPAGDSLRVRRAAAQLHGQEMTRVAAVVEPHPFWRPRRYVGFGDFALVAVFERMTVGDEIDGSVWVRERVQFL